MTKNYYLVKANIGEETPYYTFVIKAKDIDEAEKKASKIVQEDYGVPMSADSVVHINHHIPDIALPILIKELLI